MYDSRKPTNNDFINGTPIVITLEGDNWNPNSSQFECNKDAYTNTYKKIFL